jgi:SAM-dependent methyltransferase
MSDWGIGSYELTAAQLEPAAAVVIDAVEPVAGRTLLDLACGTGNATLEAASRGAEATGIDPAARLLEVARNRAQEAGLEAAWVQGDFHDLPFEDNSFGIVTSVFGVIFGASADDIASEVARVLEPSGRLGITTWIDAGPMSVVGNLIRAAVEEKVGLPPEDRPRFDWGDEDSLKLLFANHGISIQTETHRISFQADSPQQMSDEWADNHPVWLATKAAVGDERYARLRVEILAALEAGNEDPSAMKLTSEYLLVTGSPV